MVVPEGLEPPTPTLGKWRSIRLSYGTARTAIYRSGVGGATLSVTSSPSVSFFGGNNRKRQRHGADPVFTQGSRFPGRCRPVDRGRRGFSLCHGASLFRKTA